MEETESLIDRDIHFLEHYNDVKDIVSAQLCGSSTDLNLASVEYTNFLTKVNKMNFSFAIVYIMEILNGVQRLEIFHVMTNEGNTTENSESIEKRFELSDGVSAMAS